MGVAAGEAVRRVDVEGVDARQGDQVAQALQGGADQAGAAVAVVDEQPVVGDGVAVPGGARRQLAQLAVDGVPLSLLVGGDPGVDGHARRGRRDGSRRVGPHGAPSRWWWRAGGGRTGERRQQALVGAAQRVPTAAPGLEADLEGERSALRRSLGHGRPHPRPVRSVRIGMRAATGTPAQPARRRSSSRGTTNAKLGAACATLSSTSRRACARPPPGHARGRRLATHPQALRPTGAGAGQQHVRRLVERVRVAVAAPADVADTVGLAGLVRRASARSGPQGARAAEPAGSSTASRRSARSSGRRRGPSSAAGGRLVPHRARTWRCSSSAWRRSAARAASIGSAIALSAGEPPASSRTRPSNPALALGRAELEPEVAQEPAQAQADILGLADQELARCTGPRS